MGAFSGLLDRGNRLACLRAGRGCQDESESRGKFLIYGLIGVRGMGAQNCQIDMVD